MEKNYSPRAAAAVLGITVHTLQVWDREGKLRCVRLPSGRRRVPESEVRRLLNIEEQRRDAIYARAYSGDEKKDLERQVQLLNKVAPKASLYTDIRSGLNFRREGLFQLLEDIVNRKIARLYVATEDRLARIGFELVSWLCGKFGTELVAVEPAEYVPPREERVEDLMALVRAFSSKLFGLRSRKTKRILRALKDALADVRQE